MYLVVAVFRSASAGDIVCLWSLWKSSRGLQLAIAFFAWFGFVGLTPSNDSSVTIFNFTSIGNCEAVQAGQVDFESGSHG